MLWHMRVAASNILVERAVAIARELRAVGASFIIENPPTRSDKASDLFRECWSSHASLWMHSEMKPLCEERWTREVTFPQCALGNEQFQKMTTLLYSCELEPSLRPLGELRCTHAVHASQAAGERAAESQQPEARA